MHGVRTPGHDRDETVRRLERLCDEAGVHRRHARGARQRVDAVQGANCDLAVLVHAIGHAACDAGDHGDETRIGRWLVESADGECALLAAGWRVRLAGLAHVGDAAPAEAADGERAALEALHDEAVRAVEEIEAAASMAALSPAARRSLTDPIADTVLRTAERLGLPVTDAGADLARRRRARGMPRSEATTASLRFGAGIAAVAARDGRAWWHERFVERFGCDPPEGWWADGVDGGWIADAGRAEAWFDTVDERAFVEEMETRYRAELQLPARGEGWVSGAHLARCVEEALPGVEVIREARLPWLGRQRLDVFVPALSLAIEYQGEQHYLPFPHLGGETGLAARRELDERKRDACVRAGVRLVEWRYDEPVSVDAVRRRLREGDHATPWP